MRKNQIIGNDAGGGAIKTQIRATGLPALFFLLVLLLSSAQYVMADPQWTLVWDAEFNGPANSSPDPTYWTYDTGGGGWGNGELETYTNTTANAYQDGNGHLVIQALNNSGNYTSARMKTQGVFNQAYGRVEASIQLPAGGSGIWPAFWMLGQNIGSVSWPACGEIDMMEDGLPWSNTVFGGHVHGPMPGGGDYNGGAGVGVNTTLPSGTVNSGFHTYGVQWNPSQIQFYVDGSIYQTITQASVPGTWVFSHPFFILLNLAVGGPSGSPAGTAFPQQMLVSYVRVYKLTDNGTSPYGGTAATIPGTVQAENYDTYNDSNDPTEPGEGFAYNALQTGNTSGQYRTGDAISIENCSDAGGGYDVDWTSPGQWMQYTLNVTQSGSYNIDARVASSGQGGTFHFDLDGTSVTGEMTCPDTGGWQNWQDVVANAGNISAGTHTLLLVEDTLGAGKLGVCNFNYISMNLVNPPSPTPTFTPVVQPTWRINCGGAAYTDCNGNVWAADGNYTGGTAADNANTITGALPCATDQTLYQDQRYGNSFGYSFNVPAGSYQVTLKLAETYSGDFGTGDRVFNVSLNGTQVLSNFDIYRQAGGNAALDEVFNNVSPSGGIIALQFNGTSSTDTNAVVEAIQIIPMPSTPTPTFTPTTVAPVCASWITNGSAFISGKGVTLTTAVNSQAGSAWNTAAINLGQDFNMTFMAYFGAAGGADGIDFVLQKDSRGTTALGFPGGDKGYAGAPGITPSVAFDLETYGSNGTLQVLENGNTTSTCGYAGSACPYVFPSNVANGTEHTYQVVWNAAAKTLTLIFDGNVVMVYNRDLINAVFGGGSSVYYGFTAATGGSNNLQYVYETGCAMPTFTCTPASTLTQTYTCTATQTSTPTATLSYTRTVTATNTPSFTPAYTGTNTATNTITNTPTFIVTSPGTTTDTPTITPAGTKASTFTATPTNTSVQTATPTESPTFTATGALPPTLTPAITSTATRSATPSFTATFFMTAEPTATISQTVSFTVTFTATQSWTSPLTATPADTPSQTFTATLTPQISMTATPGADILVCPDPYDPGDNLPMHVFYNCAPGTVSIKLQLWSRAFRLIRQYETYVSAPETTQGKIDMDSSLFENFSNGIYYIKAVTTDGNTQHAGSKIKMFVILRKR